MTLLLHPPGLRANSEAFIFNIVSTPANAPAHIWALTLRGTYGTDPGESPLELPPESERRWYDPHVVWSRRSLALRYPNYCSPFRVAVPTKDQPSVSPSATVLGVDPLDRHSLSIDVPVERVTTPSLVSRTIPVEHRGAFSTLTSHISYSLDVNPDVSLWLRTVTPLPIGQLSGSRQHVRANLHCQRNSSSVGVRCLLR